MNYEIKNTKTGEVITTIAPRTKSSRPISRAEEALARLEQVGGKGKYEIVEVK